jgi:hypothetical protein
MAGDIASDIYPIGAFHHLKTALLLSLASTVNSQLFSFINSLIIYISVFESLEKYTHIMWR